MLPMLTYAGLLVVPVGAIVFTEHFIFPRIGLTRYWAYYKNLLTSKPAIIAWVGGLVLGFGLNALHVMSFYYLFIPAWFFTAIIYTLMARASGAREDFTKEIKEEEQLQRDIKEYQEEKALTEKVQYKDKTWHLDPDHIIRDLPGSYSYPCLNHYVWKSRYGAVQYQQSNFP